MALKGVMMSARKKDTYAVIDLGGQKGVWPYEKGEVVDKGLTVKEIRRDSGKTRKRRIWSDPEALLSCLRTHSRHALGNTTAKQPQRVAKRLG